MGNSERLKVSFLFQPFIGPLIQLPPSTWPFTTLPWHRHSNIENSQTFINQIFFSVLLSFSCPPTEGYIWFLLFWRAFSAQSIVKRILGRVRASVCACVHGYEEKVCRKNCLNSSCPFFPAFSFNQIESCRNPDRSLTYWFIHSAYSRYHQSPPWHHWSRPGSLLGDVWGRKKQNTGRRGTRCVWRGELADKWSASEDDSASRAISVTVPLICK